MKFRLDQGGTDVSTVMHQHNDGSVTIAHHQDYKHVLEENKRKQRYFAENPQKGGMREVAEIPVTIFHRWCLEAGIPFEKAYHAEYRHEVTKMLASKLNSNEYCYLRSDLGLNMRVDQ